MKKREIYKVEGNRIVRQRRNCPKCGDGVFLAEHKDRLSCGNCGYTEFKGKRPTPQSEQKPETTQPQKPLQRGPPKEEQSPTPGTSKPQTPQEGPSLKPESENP